MKVQVIYASLTGCTRRLAEAIYEGVPAENKSIHDLKDGVPALDGDVLLDYREQLGIDQHFLEQLTRAAPMHDLGKIAIDDGVLRKQGKFTRRNFGVCSATRQRVPGSSGRSWGVWRATSL